MNTVLEGERPVVAGRALWVDARGRVVVDGEAPAAGDGLARWIARSVIEDVPERATELGITVDQTNASIVVDGRLVVKIVRNWAGADRAVGLLERLAATGSADVARLRGRMLWQHPRLGTSTLALVTDYLPAATDGWTWAVDDIVSLMSRSGPDPAWPAVIGRQVARIHAALGATPHPAAPETPSQRRDRGLAALQRAVHAVDGPAGRRLRNRRGSLERDIRSLARTAPGVEFAIHGDLHLGQVLCSRAPDGSRRYTVIDFDGDPQLDAFERERPDAAARDVSHLLVSLDLAAAIAQRRLSVRDPRAFEWADRAREALIDAYRAELEDADLFDIALVAGFEAEQLVAELNYAERFLPTWRYAPDAVITRRHPSSHEHQEQPWTPPPSAPTWS